MEDEEPVQVCSRAKGCDRERVLAALTICHVYRLVFFGFCVNAASCVSVMLADHSCDHVLIVSKCVCVSSRARRLTGTLAK